MITLEVISMKTLDYAREVRNKYRKYFIHSEEIRKEQHYAWFKKLEVRKHVSFFIIKLNGKNIGTISTHEKKEYIEIHNVLLEEEYQGKGYIQEVFKLIGERYRGYRLRIEAQLKSPHAKKAYLKAGFKPTATVMFK